jgi:hypothetical protein
MPRKATGAAAEKTTAAKKTTTRRAKKTERIEPAILQWEDIATRAYYLSLESEADQLENWLRAERELALQ